MLVAVLAAFVQLTCSPVLDAQSPSRDADGDVATVLTRLAEETKKLERFTVTYRATKKEDLSTIRFVYRAPGDARLEITSTDGATSSWVVDGRFAMQSTDGERIFLDVACAELFAAGAEFDEVLAKEFPKSRDPSNRLGAGARIALELDPNGPTADGKFVSYSVSWESKRDHLLRWYEQVDTLSHARIEGDTVVWDVGERGRVVLSTKSGFIEEMSWGENFHVKLVELELAADDSEFEIPAPQADARDESPEMVHNATRLFGWMRRTQMYVSATKFMSELESADAVDAKASRAFEALNRYALPVVLAEPVREWTEQIDAFVKKYEEGRKRFANDTRAMEKLASKVQEARAELVDGLSESLGVYVERLALPKLNANPSHAEHLLALERKSARAVFEREIAAVMIERLNEGIRSAGGD